MWCIYILYDLKCVILFLAIEFNLSASNELQFLLFSSIEQRITTYSCVCVCVQFCFAALYIWRILLCTICMWLIQFCYSTSIHFSTNSWFCRDQLKTICYLNEGWIISWAFLRLSIAYSSLSHTRFRKEEALWLCIQKIKLLQARNTILNLPLLPRK